MVLKQSRGLKNDLSWIVMVMPIVRVVPVLVILGNCSVPTDSRRDYCYVVCRNYGCRIRCNGRVRIMGVLAKKRQLGLVGLGSEKQTFFTKPFYYQISIAYKVGLVGLVLK